jgi:hypothetical protein
MRSFARTVAVVGLALALTACPKPTRPPTEEKPGVPPVPTADIRGATVYQVNPQGSTVHIQVFRGGTLARLGHNHVMTVQSLRGRTWIHPTFEKSGLELAFPVAPLVVDDPEALSAAGKDFPPEIPQADREGTRKNMLRADVLDAERYPEIALRSVKVSGTAQAPQITVRITIRNASQDVVVPASVTIDGARMTASGQFDIQQTAFGIKPFSAALGALEVQDKLQINFRIVAEKKN